MENENSDAIINEILNIEADLILEINLLKHLSYVYNALKNTCAAIELGILNNEKTEGREALRRRLLNLGQRISYAIRSANSKQI